MQHSVIDLGDSRLFTLIMSTPFFFAMDLWKVKSRSRERNNN